MHRCWGCFFICPVEGTYMYIQNAHTCHMLIMFYVVPCNSQQIRRFNGSLRSLKGWTITYFHQGFSWYTSAKTKVPNIFRAISVSIGVSKIVNQNVQNEGTMPARKRSQLWATTFWVNHTQRSLTTRKWTNHHHFQCNGNPIFQKHPLSV